ncbi:MAG: ATP-binding protein [Ignavibacteria bacterium]|nr:ATP-binding protein [Ignavibacteria bacterium]
MKRIKRHIVKEALLTANTFRSICVIGPRQSGKTTLSKVVFHAKPYVNFENPKNQASALSDFDVFIKKYLKSGAILDEVQRVPEVFRYLQEILDRNQKRGQFILTGSNNFLLQEQISQSLAGRVGYLQLLPLSYAELKDARLVKASIDTHLFTGGYPEIWQQQIAPEKWMASYFQTYVQHDVRLLKNINNMAAFTRLVLLCATYAGQLLNKDSLAKSVGVDSKTIVSWLNVLESSYIIYFLQPFHNNVQKRLIKSPKLYFYDTGLLCYLLGILSVSALRAHPRYGAIYENWIITEIRKNKFNQGLEGGMYFFRDRTGNEVDLILEKQGKTYAVEIKAATSLTSDMQKGIKFWQKLRPDDQGLLLYSGKNHSNSDGSIQYLHWSEVANI